MTSKGFTLIELVLILVLVAIISVFATSRMGDVASMKAGAFTDKLRADIRYAQNIAMTGNTRVRVTFSATSYDVTMGAMHAVDPSTGKAYPILLGTGEYAGISLAMPTGFTGNYVEFDALGTPYDGAVGGGCSTAPCPLTSNKSVAVAGGGTITITARTGAIN
jgi:MSHA pilin protein MshC